MTLVLGWSQAGGAAEIVLRQRVTLRGPLVRLGDVADLSASTDARLQELITTPLMPAPAPGTRKYLRVTQLRDLLASRGISLAELTFRGAPRVALWMPPERAANLASRSKTGPSGRRPTNGGFTHRVGSDPSVRPQGNRGRPKRLKPTGPAEPAKPTESAVVTVRPVQRGMVVRAVDVEIRSPEGRVPLRAIRSLDQAIGMVAQQSLRAGVLLMESQLKAPRLVERGETVTVFARTAGIQVRTLAIARQDGSLGELIQVETADRREHFMARVAGLRELEVFATGASVAEHTTLNPGNRQLP